MARFRRSTLVALAISAALALAAVTVVARRYLIPSNIRVRNATGLALGNVTIEGVSYGAIAPGATTGYLKRRWAHKCPGFTLTADNVAIGALVDYLPEDSPLGAGNFTYVVALRTPGDARTAFICAEQ